MDFPKLLLTKVLQEQDLGPVLERGLGPDMMPTLEDQMMLRFILDFKSDHGAIPSIQLFESQFPDASLPGWAPDPASFYAEQVAKQAVRNAAIEEVLSRSKDLARGEDPFDTLSSLRGRFTELSKYGSTGREEDVREGVEGRIADYLFRKERGGLIGIPTPWQSLNDITQGWQEEMYFGIGARPKTGKTWIMLWIAWFAYLHGYNVLFFNKENATKIMNRRLDAIKFKLPYKRFKEGLLTDTEEARYFEGLRAWAEEKRDNWFVFYHGAQTTAQIRAKVDELEPDLVLVDGAYLLLPESKWASDHAKEKNISRELKAISQETRIPLGISIQLNRGGDLKNRTHKSGVAPITLADIAGSDAYAQDVDVFLGLEATPDMRAMNQMRVLPLAVREDEGDPFDIHWGFDPVDTKDLGPVTTVVEAEDDDDSFLDYE